MYSYHMSKEEEKYLSQYDISMYDRPSIATDIAVFSIMAKEGESINGKARDSKNYRKLPKKKLKILLIKRSSYPYKNCWALPGGFCRKNEDVYESARRELFEETHVKNAYLQLSGIFGDAKRDPRGWIISHTFLALINGEKCRLRAGTDAWEARWFDVELYKEEKRKEIGKDTAVMENVYKLHLTNENENAPIDLSAEIRENRIFNEYHETSSFELEDTGGLAFDHAKIITHTLILLRRQAEADGKTVFDLMPEYFTLTELQKAFEIIQDKQLLTANFRRKMADYVVETDQMSEGAGHRPAKLFQRNLEMFYR